MESSLMSISCAFASDLYTKLVKNQAGNFVFSPVYVQSLLTFLSIGADHGSSTRKELLEGLKLAEGTDAAQILEQFHKKIRVDVPTKIYLMRGYLTKPSFEELARNSFNMKVEAIDFAKKVEAAGTINGWIFKQPNMKIRRLVEPSLDSDSRMVCVSVIGFNALLRSKFMPAKPYDFHLNEKESIRATFCWEVDYYDYAFLSDFNAQALKIQLRNSDVRMIILLPVHVNGLARLEKNLHRVNFAELPGQFKSVRTSVSLPFFKIETDFAMEQALKDMGMHEMFTDDAKFHELLQNCHDTRPLRVGGVYQRAVISVAEVGSVAECGAPFGLHTGFMDVTRGLLPVPVDFIADHPFMFILMDEDAVLLMGRVTKP